MTFAPSEFWTVISATLTDMDVVRCISYQLQGVGVDTAC